MIAIPCACYAQLCFLSDFEQTYSKSKGIINQQAPVMAEENMCEILKKKELSLSICDFITQFNPCDFSPDLSRFQVLIHALVFPSFLYYLGVFKDVSPTLSWLRINGIQIMEIWDCGAVVVGLLISGIIKDLYCIENYAATILVDSENDPNNLSKYYLDHT